MYLLLGGHGPTRQSHLLQVQDLSSLPLTITHLPVIDGNQPVIYSVLKLPASSKQWHMAAKVSTNGHVADLTLVYSFSDQILIRTPSDYEGFVELIRERLAKHNFKLHFLMTLTGL